MTPQLEFDTTSHPEAAQRLGEILCQCFNFDDWQIHSSRMGLENFRVVRQGGQVVGGLGMHALGQWFGGHSVPMVGLAAVGVSPENRGTGVAAFLLSQTLKELHAKGVPLSALYASTNALYRKVGYEQAGTLCTFALQTQSIRISDRRLPIHRVDPTNCQILLDLYRLRAIGTSGNLDRNQFIWERIVQSKKEIVYAYLVGEEKQPEGYVIFTQKPGAKYNLLVGDLVALTPAAASCLWSFFAAHRSLAEEVWWRGPAIDPLLSLLPEQTYRVQSLERWLLRVIDVPKALEKRGYPTGVEAELHLAVQDNLLPENNGNFVLTVSGGRGKVTPGGRGELQLDVRGLAPLYTGLFTPYQLQNTGRITTTTSALAVAAQIFAGPEPWMSDRF